jgi:hypothetical protein
MYHYNEKRYDASKILDNANEEDVIRKIKGLQEK